ncbi:homocysteine S-methyltransferase family protein [Cognatiyoonia sp. IB215182]|uniref:homocysteine S-methyltransferase family protein n=1 Tax=Cognatiyoonia sp. IB215182 TaxID=3097353 RepID=UPI002A11F382|nr:homocysteine S-methyltransferase family protein [Cognatiyoonia sp. IB215182]MDX8352847.1 homocysteine S-methyltransferase family protein [Cognatiyoonia sp. IB215182]
MTAITLLDGGMGQELIHRAGDKPTPLWSTQVMVDHPGLVAEVHAAYRAAGATVHTANTYAIHRDRLVDTPLADKFADLHAAALAEARGSGRIAGAIGPLAASYRPDIHPDHEVAVPLYAEVARLLAPDVDLIICETVASVAHARAILEGARAAGKPIWLALTVDDEDGTKLRSGEPLADTLPLAEADAAAILVNCAAPEAIPAAMDALARGALPFGAYANAFTQITKEFLQDKPTVAALSARRDIGPEAYAQSALGWIRQGATIVGGCCEVGPAHIAALANAIKSAGHTIE